MDRATHTRFSTRILSSRVHTERMSAQAPSTRSSRIRSLLLALVTLALAFLLIVGGAFAYLRHSIDSQIRHISIEATPDQPPQSALAHSPTAVHDTLNFLILGSDSRSSGGNPSDWHAGAQRSDVMMVLQLSANRSRLSVMSLPRDLWVPIPGHGEGKINSAYSLGGPELTISTVEGLLGSPIHHFAVVDFESFAQMTDQIGGVTVNTTSGPQHLNGTQALAFVRERYSLPNGDLDRVRRQQAWIQALLNGIFEQKTLQDPVALHAMLHTLLSHSAVDEGLTFDSLTALALESRTLQRGGIVFFTAPVNPPSTSSDGQSILTFQSEAMDQLRRAWAEDRVKEFVASSPDVHTLGVDPIY